MFELLGPRHRNCDGVTRRSFLRVGFLGIAGLSLADHLRLQAESRASGRSTKDTAVILFYMSGGPSHIDTYDPKPDAPLEFRGEFRPIPTNVPGIQISEHLPRQARLMDKMAVVRSLTHSNGAHGMANHWMMTGYASPLETSENLNPSCGSITAKLRGANAPRLPPYVCLPNPLSNANAAYLGVANNPFSPGGDPNAPDFQVRNLRLTSRVDMARFNDRRGLREGLDKLRRQHDIEGVAEGYDRFYHDAFDIVTSEDCRKAFDLNKEEPRLRDRYGRDTFGQSALLARRLIESGVTFVAVDTTFGWDTHDNNFQILKGTNLPPFDRTLSALVSDLHDRGLDKKVLVVCYGEFGRTPRVNGVAGRDHWPGAMFALLSGGGLKMGQVVGSTDGRGEYPRTRPVGPQDVLATVYHVLGIDYRQVFHDTSGRPITVLNEGQPIEELI
jgi:hypothetical protein